MLVRMANEKILAHSGTRNQNLPIRSPTHYLPTVLAGINLFNCSVELYVPPMYSTEV